MNAIQINAKIYQGRGKAALRLGFDYNVFRPVLRSTPLANQIATLKVAFNATDNVYAKPNMPGKPYWFADLDANITRAGDYLVRGDQIFFIAAQQSLLPIITVECNRTLRMTSAAVVSAAPERVGALGYSGLCASPGESSDVLGVNPATNNGFFEGWPCSILFGKGKLKNADALPSGTPEQIGWQILLPPSLPVVISASDQLVDDLGRRYVVNAAEQSDSGWRLAVFEVHA